MTAKVINFCAFRARRIPPRSLSYAMAAAGHYDVRLPARLEESGVLLCPNCRNNYLHHGATSIYNREREYGPGARVLVQGSEVESSSLNADDGSWASRRDHIEIAFSCEACSAHLTLNLIQHKGQTLIKWVVK